MASLVKWVLGAGTGATLMYLFDPDRGARRRESLRIQASSATHRLRHAAATTASDTRNRVRGLRASLRSRLQPQPVNDEILTERVRSALGHCTSHPSAIDVAVKDGNVVLTGAVLTGELPLVLDRVHGVAGVVRVSHGLQMHARSEDVPELQGTGKPVARRHRLKLFRSHWSPAMRLGAGAVAASGTFYGVIKRGWLAKTIGIVAGGLLARAVTNMDLMRLTGIRKRYSISIQKSIRIDAPIERVFETWANNANFPLFMTHVLNVRALDAGGAELARRWHWTVRGPTGMEIEFNSQTTAYEQNRFLAWRSEPDSVVQHAGYVRFQENGDRSTTADVRLSYTPPAGAIGHIIAKMLGSDPKSQLNDDLRRMKGFIETGRPSKSGATLHESPIAGGAQPEF